MVKTKLFMGCDVGTSGVRVSICTEKGQLVASSSLPFTDCEVNGLPVGWHEQHPQTWVDTTFACIQNSLQQIKEKGFTAANILSLAVDSTSGTVIALDGDHQPLTNAIMYNDGRAQLEASQLNEVAQDYNQKIGSRFAASFALAKILWIKHNQPVCFEKTSLFVHACDFINGSLTGDYSTSDFSNALKTGYDIADYCWPDFIENKVGIPIIKLPRVATPGETIGLISPGAANQTGLPTTCQVCAGLTDSNAAFVATGAADVGDWFTTIGTTMVVKGITSQPLIDPEGVIYNHRHPDGFWLPGAAGNVGGECLAVNYKGRNLKDLDQAALQHGPASIVVYPLVRKGERFPFMRADAEGFMLGTPLDEIDRYRATLEGVAFTEKLGYEILVKIGAKVGKNIYTGGGGVKSPLWLQIRADVLGKTLIKPKFPDASLGCAMLAASRTYYNSLVEAAQAMAQLDQPVIPDLKTTDRYQEKYLHFKEEMVKRGYLRN